MENKKIKCKENLIQYLLLSDFITVRASDYSIVFGIVAKFFLFCQHDNSWTAALSLMKFCTKMYLYNL